VGAVDVEAAVRPLIHRWRAAQWWRQQRSHLRQVAAAVALVELVAVVVAVVDAVGTRASSRVPTSSP
jgi:ABC-type proline/glycine betaine transport system permease subunit